MGSKTRWPFQRCAMLSQRAPRAALLLGTPRTGKAGLCRLASQQGPSPGSEYHAPQDASPSKLKRANAGPGIVHKPPITITASIVKKGKAAHNKANFFNISPSTSTKRTLGGYYHWGLNPPSCAQAGDSEIHSLSNEHHLRWFRIQRRVRSPSKHQAKQLVQQ